MLVPIAVEPESWTAKSMFLVICEYNGDPVGLDESRRPMANAPQPPARLTYELRYGLAAVLTPPVSAAIPNSKPKPALRPPPRSSTPLKPRREELSSCDS